MKYCNVCKKLKPINQFYRNKSIPNGYRHDCKDCFNAYQKRWNEINPSLHRKYDALWQQRNPGKVREKAIRWKENNRERWRANKRRQEKNRRMTVIGKLQNSIHCGVYGQLKKNKKGQRAFDLLGYSPDVLKRHLEKQFIDGMTWDNYGEWHIDHIIPQSAFYITSAEDIDFKRCWALNNLRPLWASDNIKKHSKLDRPFQPSLNIALTD